MNIQIGTASWTDKSLIASKRFYPKGCTSPEDRLRFYARVFPVVEVDSRYYALPSHSNAEKWVERTPDNFTFNIKAFRIFTGHQTPKEALPKDIAHALAAHFNAKRNLYYKDTPEEVRDELWRRYEDGIRPLHEAGKLAVVHFQFPKWFLPGSDSWAHVDECMERLCGYQLATEFPRDLWFDECHRETTIERERNRGLVHVVVDAPEKATAVPAVWEVTNPEYAIVRLHGRNHQTWDSKTAVAASERFNYDYSESELTTLVPRIEALESAAALVKVIFNNNYEDQGPRDATTLGQVIGSTAKE